MVRGRGAVATLTRGRRGEARRGRSPRVSAADAEAEVTGDGAASLLDDLADGLLGVLGERLIQEAVLLEEAVQAALDDLRQRLLGLALVFRGLLGVATILGDGLLGDDLAREDLRGECCMV